MTFQLEHIKKHDGVVTTGTDDSTSSKPMLEHSQEHQYSKTKKKPYYWVCDHYKGKGHIRPYCFKLHGEPSQQKFYKKRWNPRSINTGLITHTSLRASFKEDRSFDSGCSRHMTEVDKYLEEVGPYASSYVTFGDVTKRKIVGIVNLIKNGLPRLDNVLLVKGLTANLISISKLCDQGLEVNFTKPECQLSDKKGEVLMRGTRSNDNCYLWVSQEEAHVSTCLLRKEE